MGTVIVMVTGTGLVAVGVYEPEGVKLQVAPLGSPLQASDTVPLKVPAPVKLSEVAVVVALGNVVSEEGEGAEMSKSTTSKFKPVAVRVKVPSVAWALKS